MLIERWVDEQTWYIHTDEYYAAIKRGTDTLQVENIKLSEKSQTQKNTVPIQMQYPDQAKVQRQEED